jgi:hypothetical protein
MNKSPRRSSSRGAPTFTVVYTRRRRHVTGRPLAAVRSAKAETEDLSTLILYGQG